MSLERPELSRLQRWMQEVVVHPGTVEEAIESAEAEREIPSEDLGEVVLPSHSMTSAERIGAAVRATQRRVRGPCRVPIGPGGRRLATRGVGVGSDQGACYSRFTALTVRSGVLQLRRSPAKSVTEVHSFASRVLSLLKSRSWDNAISSRAVGARPSLR